MKFKRWLSDTKQKELLKHRFDKHFSAKFAQFLNLKIQFMSKKLSIGKLIEYYKDLSQFKKSLGNNPEFPFGKKRMIMNEKNVESGTMSGHYFHQDLLAARRIFQNNPAKHVDIGSRTDGFVAHVASYREIEVFDIRPLDKKVVNVKFVQADFMKMPEHLISYTDSVSCLHAIEHFGLGRYGDPIDANGHLKGLDSINKLLKGGGKFYFSTPIGQQRIEFNAHRVFSVKYLLNLFRDGYNIDHFSFVDDKGVLHENAELTQNNIDQSFNCHYGCGIFEMTKR